MKRTTGAPAGVETIKTMKGRGLRSIPRHGDDNYLDLYMLKKEKERLEKELSHSGKRGQVANKRLQSIQERIDKLERSSHEGDRGNGKEVARRNTPGKGWKVVSIDY